MKLLAAQWAGQKGSTGTGASAWSFPAVPQVCCGMGSLPAVEMTEEDGRDDRGRQLR
jgi:hypothetical protein